MSMRVFPETADGGMKNLPGCRQYNPMTWISRCDIHRVLLFGIELLLSMKHLFYFSVMYMLYVWVCAHQFSFLWIWSRGCHIRWSWSFMKSWASQCGCWEGTKPRPSVRTVNILKHRAISPCPVPIITIFMFTSFCPHLTLSAMVMIA